MRMSNKVIAVILVVAGAAILIYYLGNKSGDSKQFEKGSIQDGEYRNDYFNFTFPIPDRWQVVDDNTLKRVQKEGAEAMGEQNPKLKSELEKGSEGIMLLMLSKGEPGSEGTISILFEAIELSPMRAAATSSDDFLDGTIHGIEDSVPGMRIITPVGPARLGGTDFAHCEYEVTVNGLSMRQRIIARITKRHALVFYLTGFSSADMQELAAVLEKIRFDD